MRLQGKSKLEKLLSSTIWSSESLHIHHTRHFWLVLRYDLDSNRSWTFFPLYQTQFNLFELMGIRVGKLQALLTFANHLIQADLTSQSNCSLDIVNKYRWQMFHLYPALTPSHIRVVHEDRLSCFFIILQSFLCGHQCLRWMATTKDMTCQLILAGFPLLMTDLWFPPWKLETYRAFIVGFEIV